MIAIEATVSTANKNLGEDVEVEIEVTVPENIGEASDFYGSEEKLLESIQADVKRKKTNAARPYLRDATGEPAQGWVTFAQQMAENYVPGRRGGFGAVTVTEDEIAAASSDMESLAALLASKGVTITQ